MQPGPEKQHSYRKKRVYSGYLVIKRSFFSASFFAPGTKRGYNSKSTVVLTSTDTTGIVFVIGRDSEP